MVVVVGTVVVVVEEGGGLVEVVVGGGRVLVDDVTSGSVGGAGCSAEQPAIPSKSAIHAPAIAIVRGAAPVLIPLERVVLGPLSILARQFKRPLRTFVRPGDLHTPNCPVRPISRGRAQLSGTS